MEINFASKKKKSSKNPSKLIEAKILQRLPPDSSGDGVQVMVTEVSCTEPDCVPLETLIICIGMQARWADKVLKPIAEVTDSDIEELVLGLPTNWTEWIHSEVERKRLKNAQASDSDQSNQSSFIPATTPTTTTSTLITMRPRTDQTNPQGISQASLSSTVITSSTTASVSVDNTSNLPPPPPSTDDNIKTQSTIQISSNTTEPMLNSQKVKKQPVLKSRDEKLPTARHSSKGVRQRGCPCCGE